MKPQIDLQVLINGSLSVIRQHVMIVRALRRALRAQDKYEELEQDVKSLNELHGRQIARTYYKTTGDAFAHEPPFETPPCLLPRGQNDHNEPVNYTPPY